MNVYDFDNTIYAGESAFDFFVYCARRNPRFIKFLPRVMWVVAKYKMCCITKEELFALVAKYEAEFLSIAGDIKQLTRDFWDKNIHKIKDFYKNIHRSDDVILSASFDFLLEDAAGRLGITNLVCSRMDLKTGNLLELCFADNKPRLLQKYFPNAEVDNFYTDSLNDMPMIKIAKRAYIVKGNKLKEYKPK